MNLCQVVYCSLAPNLPFFARFVILDFVSIFPLPSDMILTSTSRGRRRNSDEERVGFSVPGCLPTIKFQQHPCGCLPTEFPQHPCEQLPRIVVASWRVSSALQLGIPAHPVSCMPALQWAETQQTLSSSDINRYILSHIVQLSVWEEKRASSKFFPSLNALP